MEKENITRWKKGVLIYDCKMEENSFSISKLWDKG
jgi:hypothetical protein